MMVPNDTFSSTSLGDHVCVIGAGALGLVAIKNLVEQGLRVTAFERNEQLGGLWRITNDPDKVSALLGTRSNISKQAGCFTDFPMPEDYPTYPSSVDLQRYLEQYARHFGFSKFISFSTNIRKVTRNENDTAWVVFKHDEKSGENTVQEFDRVVVATGMLSAKKQPDVKDIETFTGKVIHSREFKDPTIYTGKNVLVVGIGSTGADTLCFLKAAGVKKLYLSHRQQFYMLPRTIRGHAFDYWLTRRFGNAVRLVASWSPCAASTLLGKAMRYVQMATFPHLKSHHSFCPPRILEGAQHRLPFFSDDLPIHFANGEINVMHGISKICGPRSVTFFDGATISDLDAIIFCTGYYYDSSIIKGPGCPTDPAFASDDFERLQKARFYNQNEDFPRLYQGILSERYPESLAFLGHFVPLKPAFVVNDLASMAIASLWSGSYPLPSKFAMKKNIDAYYDSVVSVLERGPIPHIGFRINYREVYEWMNEVAGTGIVERLGRWGWEAWKLWWTDPKLYYLLMDGLDAPAAYRLFDAKRGRRAWMGARDIIERTNNQIFGIGA